MSNPNRHHFTGAKTALYIICAGLLMFAVARTCHGAETVNLMNPENITVHKANKWVDDGGIRGATVATYLTGIAKGAYVGYIFELMDGGLPAALASKIAAENCGSVSAYELMNAFRKNPKVQDTRADIVLVAGVRAYCKRGDTDS